MSVDLRLSCMIKTWSLRDAYIHDIMCLNICFFTSSLPTEYYGGDGLEVGC